MLIDHRWFLGAAVVASLLILLRSATAAGGPVVPASAPSQDASRKGTPSPTCADLLTDAEVTTVMGRAPATKNKETTRAIAGDSICDWSWGADALTFRFQDRQGLTATVTRSMALASGAAWPLTLPQYFDYLVKLWSSRSTVEPVPAIGERAAVTSDGPQSFDLVVQRPDGVGILLGINLTRAQILRLARAAVTP